MSQPDLENLYYAYLRSHAYSSETALQEALQVYVKYFSAHHRVLDIGCGHGEFLQLLTQAGHDVVGVDIDPQMVDACRRQGFTVHTADAITWLSTTAEQFDAVFSSNVIEHLTTDTVIGLLTGINRVLRPGGLVLLATPNPESVITQFHEFWRDPTHVRMYSRQLLEFMVHNAGFEAVSSDANQATRWNDIDDMLAEVEQKPLPLPVLPEFAPPPPLPEPPANGASLRARLAYRITMFLYHKVIEPFIAPLATYVAELKYLHTALQQSVVDLQLLQTQTRSIASAYRFLYPPREIFVVGTKPLSPPPTT